MRTGSRPPIAPRLAAWLGVMAALLTGMAASFALAQTAPKRMNVGVLRFSSSGPIFIARDRGYFKAEGLDVDLVFFEAAPSLTVAVASGDVAFGATALTGAFFNLAAQGGLKILAGQAREEKGRPGNSILVTRRAFDAGTKTLEALFPQPFGLTQFGSPSHYQLGQLAKLHGVDAKSIPIRAFQALPNLVAAIKGGQVAWAIIAPPISTDLVASGDAVEIGRYADHGGYQFGVVFTSTGLIERDAEAARAFLRGYARGLADYAVLNADAPASDPQAQAKARETAAIVARHVYPGDDAEAGVRKTQRSALFVDPTGAVDVADVARQIAWYREQGMLTRDLNVNDLLRLDLFERR